MKKLTLSICIFVIFVSSCQVMHKSTYTIAVYSDKDRIESDFELITEKLKEVDKEVKDKTISQFPNFEKEKIINSITEVTRMSELTGEDENYVILVIYKIENDDSGIEASKVAEFYQGIIRRQLKKESLKVE